MAPQGSLAQLCGVVKPHHEIQQQHSLKQEGVPHWLMLGGVTRQAWVDWIHWWQSQQALGKQPWDSGYSSNGGRALEPGRQPAVLSVWPSEQHMELVAGAAGVGMLTPTPYTHVIWVWRTQHPNHTRAAGCSVRGQVSNGGSGMG